MAENDQQIIERALGVIEEVAGRGLAGQVEQDIGRFGLSRATLATHLRRASALAWPWQTGWESAAVGWLLAKLVKELERYLMTGSPQSDKVAVDGLMTTLNGMTETQLRQQLSGRRVDNTLLLQSIAQQQQSRSRNVWDPNLFSDPQAHNPSVFRYIVHALRPSANIPKGNFDLQYFRNQNRDYLSEDNTSFTLQSARLYLTDPTVLHREILSCSVIDAKHCRTYGGFTFGFILRVPKSNIVYASTKDFATDFNKTRAEALVMQKPRVAMARIDSFLDELLGMYSQSLSPPLSLLRSSTGHNEVIVLGSLGGGTMVKASGIFVKVSVDFKLWRSFLVASEKSLQENDASLIGLIKRCSSLHQLPVVPIPEPNRQNDVASEMDIYSVFGQRVRPTRSRRLEQRFEW